MRLRNAPLVHVLAQVAFPALPKWEEQIDDMRELMGELGFPRGQRFETQEFTVALGVGAAGHPVPVQPVQPVTRVHWEFGSRTQRTGFVFSESMLVLHTSEYRSRRPFFETLRGALDALAATRRMSLVDRLGLRYIDFVQTRANESVGRYVHPGLLGFPFATSPALQATRGAFATQSVAVTPHGSLAVRSGVLPAGQYLPPDLGQVTVLPPERPDLARGGLVVDFDHFTMFTGPGTRSMDFDPASILSHLNSLHGGLRAAFDAITTPYAIEVWGPWEPERDVAADADGVPSGPSGPLPPPFPPTSSVMSP